MNKSSKLIALRILQLLEEFSDKELQDAVALLKKNGHSSDFIHFLAQERKKPVSNEKKSSERVSTPKSLNESISRVVLNLKKDFPDKYRVLAEFDLMLRRGQLLQTHEDLRRFGERVSKDFESKKARKETIGELMRVLVDRQVSDIEKLIELATEFGLKGNTDEYQRLAQFLIRGKSSITN